MTWMMMIGLVAPGMLMAQSLVTAPKVPMISNALSCGRAGTIGGLAPGNEMQRHNLDLTRYPQAMCNDGSGGAFYYRPYNGAANRNRWVIQLQGGGACNTPDDCAKRWCRVDTPFSMVGMSSNLAPPNGINAAGIMERHAGNPFGDYNHVFIKYCSSDLWSGTARDTIVEATDPVTGAPVVMKIHFLGSRILDAAIATLRRDGGLALNYTLTGSTEMPTLDDAEVVILTGGSAGGGGVAYNADRIYEELKRTNIHCRDNAACTLDFRALQDSALPPDMLNLDLRSSVLCERGLCTPQQYFTYVREEGQEALWRSRRDDSCETWHRNEGRGSEWQCGSLVHVLMHHVTTPLFVRMGQTDQLHTQTFLDLRASVPNRGVMTIDSFSAIVRDQMSQLGKSQTAHEASQRPVMPGGFSPTCAAHEVLRDNEQIYGVLIASGTRAYTMFQVFDNWLTGRQPSMVVAPNAAANRCP